MSTVTKGWGKFSLIQKTGKPTEVSVKTSMFITFLLEFVGGFLLYILQRCKHKERSCIYLHLTCTVLSFLLQVYVYVYVLLLLVNCK